MADLSLNSLSVDAVQAELRGTEEDKLKKQAANNVLRQREAASLRGDIGKKPAASSSKPASAPKAEKSDAEKEIQELADCIQKVQSFMSNPKLRSRLMGIPTPRNGSLAEYKVCLEQIRNKLGEGLAGQSVRKVYKTVMGFGIPFLEAETVPSSIRMPPNTAEYLSQAIDKGAFEDEFEELAIEYSKFFRSGPIPRLIMGTFYSLLEYKKLCETGLFNPITMDFNPEFKAFIQQQEAPASSLPASSSQSYFSAPVTQPEPPAFPPPMKIYPDRPEPSAPEMGYPTVSSRESFFDLASQSEPVQIKTEEEIGSIILPVERKKKSNRGGKGRAI